MKCHIFRIECLRKASLQSSYLTEVGQDRRVGGQEREHQLYSSTFPSQKACRYFVVTDSNNHHSILKVGGGGGGCGFHSPVN